ncbi:MAG: lytic transglycosylase domain-containing protein [Acetobacteraceae bacterium]|nr:lytic transglycosylase domain-containing protein [Acetobacteraceae bacterium]
MILSRSALSAVVLGAALGAALPKAKADDVATAVRAERWADAAALASVSPDPLALTLVTYLRLLAPQAGSAAEIGAFLASNPDWPNRAQLEHRRDEALAREPDNAAVLGQCRLATIRLPEALLRCAEAFTAAGEADPAAASIRTAWRTGIRDKAAESAFLLRYAAIVTPNDQWARFSQLAWTDADAASRQVARLDPARRPQAEARLALKRRDPYAPGLLAALPPGQRAEPALLLEYARWLRRSGQDEAAAAVWLAGGEAAQRDAEEEHRAEFWAERNVLARRLLAAGDAANAFAVAALGGQTSPEAVSDGAFLAGFVALRRLHDPEKAAQKFGVVAVLARAAVSQARIGYWTGRALAASGQDPTAAFARAAAFPLTFYGQRAALAAGETPGAMAARIRDLADPPWTREQVSAFVDSELVRAATLLTAWGEPRRAAAFLLRADELAGDTAVRSLGARFALSLGLPDVAVAIARRLGREGLALPGAGWPVPFDPPPGGVDPAIVLGLIRQESSFDTGAVSPAGARGLMQLMPATAEGVARRLGEQTSGFTLTTDGSHNMRLGTAYLAAMLDQFGGSLPLAAAAYNAGPNRVREWLGSNGDPRAGTADMLDWIELIPFTETRNYVQRVLENTVVYAAKRHVPAGHDPLLRSADGM